jgi:hypothetical protein
VAKVEVTDSKTVVERVMVKAVVGKAVAATMEEGEMEVVVTEENGALPFLHAHVTRFQRCL